MSSFLVSNRCLNSILSLFYFENTTRAKLPAGIDNTCEGLEELGRKLLDLNIDATCVRYSDKKYVKGKKDFLNFIMDVKQVSKIESAKALHCLRYQCSEGSIERKKLYKWLTLVVNQVDAEIVSELPKYVSAPWGD